MDISGASVSPPRPSLIRAASCFIYDKAEVDNVTKVLEKVKEMTAAAICQIEAFCDQASFGASVLPNFHRLFVESTVQASILEGLQLCGDHYTCNDQIDLEKVRLETNRIDNEYCDVQNLIRRIRVLRNNVALQRINLPQPVPKRRRLSNKTTLV